MQNPLLQETKTVLSTTPFSKIDVEHFLPAVKELINRAKSKIVQIKSIEDSKLSFDNCIEEFERSDSELTYVVGIFFNLHGAESTPRIQELAKEISPLITEFANDVILDGELFAKLKVIYQKKEKLHLNTEQLTLLDKLYKSFVRNGANLNEKQKEELRAIDQEMSTLTLHFSDHVLKESTTFLKIIEDKKDLSGLPEDTLEASMELAKKKGHPGKYAFTLDVPSYMPLMTYADNRELRKEMFLAYNSRCLKGGETDNKELIKKISRLRFQRAKLLGYPHHSAFVLEERMAGSPKVVDNFLQDIQKKSKPIAIKQMKELEAFAKKLGLKDSLQRYDATYYSEKLKMELYNIDDEMLRPYFKLENVTNGAFTVAKNLYGITFHERSDIDKYHPEVKTYEIKDEDGKHVGVFYADFFPRDGKRGGAWMTSYREQHQEKNHAQHPHISIVCNFTRPTESRPSLLTFNEVQTLFHEFGHALHGILSNVQYRSLSGTNVFWDFVELPSQIMENWVFEKECLELFATHYQTGEVIPLDMIKKIKDSSNFMEGVTTLRQVSLGLIDMAYHTMVNGFETMDVMKVEEEAIKDTNLLPSIPGVAMCGAFSHIFSGGYSSGYYSYKWAEVLDADAFDYFREKGIFNKEVAKKFKDHILSKGGTEHPMELYKRFRGKEPSVDALLKRAGLWGK